MSNKSLTVGLADTLRHPSFNRLATMFRVLTIDREWQAGHPIEIYNALKRFELLVGRKASDAKEAVVVFSRLVAAVREADPEMEITADDIAWMLSILQGESAGLTISLLLAVSVTEYKTAAQAAADSGKSESYWRNASAAGDVPGAYKVAKTWMIPAWYVRHIR